MIVLLGASGYVGLAYQRYFARQGVAFVPVARRDVDYYDREVLARFLKSKGATFLINAAGYTGKPNVDACEAHKGECLLGNAVLPGVIKEACETVGIPWGHVSSGCIFSGRRADGQGFEEADAPNFSFRASPCSFYSGTKALGEEVLAEAKACYIWRLRIPFDHRNNPRNYLTKLIRYARLLEAENSISHLDDFVEATWQCWAKRVPFGLYNVTNPGAITTRGVVEMMLAERKRRLALGEPSPFPETFSFFDSEDEFMKLAAKTPRSNCVLDTRKLTSVGIELRPATEAITACLRQWEDAPLGGQTGQGCP